jgi:hypothetical protein
VEIQGWRANGLPLDFDAPYMIVLSTQNQPQLPSCFQKMNNIPLIDLSEIFFGSTKKEINSVLGQPDNIINKNGSIDDLAPEVWSYSNEGVNLSFDPFYEFRLEKIDLTSNQFLVDGKALIGIDEGQLQASFRNAVLTETYGRCKEYEDEPNGFVFILKDETVIHVLLTPDPNIPFINYCSESKQRYYTCKRLLKRNCRRHERRVAKGLFVLQEQLSGSHMGHLASDIEWFLGSYITLLPSVREFWCDGVVFKSFQLISKRTVRFSASAYILSTVDESFSEEPELEGFIQVANNGKTLKAYFLTLKLASKDIKIRKRAGTAQIFSAMALDKVEVII